MKKLMLIILFLCLTVGGFFTIKLLYDKGYDISIQSQDGIAELRFEQIGENEATRLSTNSYGFQLKKGISLFNDYISDNKGYVYSLDAANKISLDDTGKYILCIDKRYFYVKSAENSGVIIKDLSASFYPYDGVRETMISPILADEDFSFERENEYSWSDTAGLSSFEDLVTYYERTDSKLYEIDEKNKCIYLALYNDSEWIPKAAKILTDEAGLRIVYIANDDVQTIIS